MSEPIKTTSTTSQSNIGEVLGRHAFLIVVAACFAFFALYTDSFLNPDNLLNIVSGSSILLILALAMTLIVALGGIDLSIGIAFDFGAAFAIVAMKEYDLAWYLAVLIGLAGGALVGLMNALLVVKLSISPFLATLGTFFIGSSIQRIFTHGGGPISHRQVPQGFRDIGVGTILGIPSAIMMAFIVLVIYYVLLERSIFGKRIHAIGLQRRAALIAGIKVDKFVALGFVFAGTTCAIGGIIGSATLRMFTPLAGYSYLMGAIAAVFIGASVHPRGRPNVLGTMIAVLFLGMIANGLNLMGLDFNLKDALSGIILVAALTLAVVQTRLAKR